MEEGRTMRRSLSILLLLLTLAACASQRLPAATPAQPLPHNGLIVYTTTLPPETSGLPARLDLGVADDQGRQVHTLDGPESTLPLSTYQMNTRAPNKAIYRAQEAYWLVDAAQATISQLPISGTSILGPSSRRANRGRRWMIMAESPYLQPGPGAPDQILVDLERGSAVDLVALTKATRFLDVALSPDEAYLLAIIDYQTLALIPTAEPEKWWMVNVSGGNLTAEFSPDSQWLIYPDIQDQKVEWLMAPTDGSPPKPVPHQSGAPRFMHDPNLLLSRRGNGLSVIELGTNEQRILVPATANPTRPTLIFLSDTDDTLLFWQEDIWHFVDLRTGAATPLPELAGAVPRSPEGRPWVVFGTAMGGDVIYSVPTRIIDLHTGAITTLDDPDPQRMNDIIDVAPDGSAALIRDRFGVQVFNSDGSIHRISRLQQPLARFSPDGRLILLANTMYNPLPAPGPITIFGRDGQLIQTLEVPGMDPVWLEQ
jgi:hypothetical protein